MSFTQLDVQEQVLNRLKEYETAEFQPEQPHYQKGQQKLTIIDAIQRRQTQQAKLQLSCLESTQKDITSSGAGAAGHGVDLEKWIHKTRVKAGEKAHTTQLSLSNANSATILTNLCACRRILAKN